MHEVTTYSTGIISSTITFIVSFVKISRLVSNVALRNHGYVDGMLKALNYILSGSKCFRHVPTYFV
jgi:hypothetical protein